MAAHDSHGVQALGLAAPSRARFPAAGLAPLGAPGASAAWLTAGHKEEPPGRPGHEGFRGQTGADRRDSHGALVLGQPASAAGPTMTSLELVEFINSQRGDDDAELRHDHFMAKVPKVLGEEHAPKFRDMLAVTIGNGATRQSPIYRFPKREACLMAMSYSYDLQARVFDRMTQLEQAASSPALPDFTDPAAAARAWADQHEQRQRLEVVNRQQAEALAIAAPKAAGLDRIASVSEGAASLRVAAKVANVPERQFIGFLIANCWLYRQGRGLLAKADKERAGWVETKRVEVQRKDGSTMAVARVFITTSGLAKLAVLIERKAPHLRKAKTATASQQTQLVLPMLAASAQEGRAP